MLADCTDMPASRSAICTVLPMAVLSASRSLTSPVRMPAEACVPWPSKRTPPMPSASPIIQQIFDDPMSITANGRRVMALVFRKIMSGSPAHVPEY